MNKTLSAAAWFGNFNYDPDHTGYGLCFYSGWADKAETQLWCSTSILIIF